MSTAIAANAVEVLDPISKPAAKPGTIKSGLAKLQATPPRSAPVKVKEKMELESDDMVQVEIPEDNITGGLHPGVTLNGIHWGPGVHTLPRDIADEVKRILARYQNSQLDLIRVNKAAVHAAQDRVARLGTPIPNGVPYPIGL